MLFLEIVWNKPSTWISGAAEGIMGGILNAVRTFCFWLVGIIYELLVNVYNLFYKLCSARLLDNEILDAMSQRIGIILGIIMFFYIIFSLIQMVIDPEKISNKDSGAVAIIRKAILVIVMLGMSGFVFDLMFGIQKKIMDENVISKLILPFAVDDESKEKFGNLLSASLIKVFYYVDEELVKKAENSELLADSNDANSILSCNTMVKSFYAQIYNNNTYTLGNMCLIGSVNVKSIDSNRGLEYDDQTYIVSFNGIVSIIVGAYMIYVLLMYCFKVGVRLIQLTFLEIISPMPIIAYMSPKKDNMFGKWLKLYFATYIDVFIRVAIINFAVYMICIIFSEGVSGFRFWDTIGTVNSLEKGFLMVVLVLSLLTFAKKAPDLLKELLPAGASKLGFGTAMKDIVGLEKGVKWTGKAATGILGGAAAGAAIGLIGGTGWNKLSGLAGGFLKGGLSGLKGQGLKKTAASAWKNQKETNKRIADWKAAGGTNPFARWGTSVQQTFGWKTASDIIDEENQKLEDDNKALASFSQYYKDIDSRAEKKILDGSFNSNANARRALEEQRNIQSLQASLNDLEVNKSKYNLYDGSGNYLGFDQDRYDDDKSRLNEAMNNASINYKTYLDAAKDDYYVAKKDSDDVIRQAITKIDAATSSSSFDGITIDKTNISTLKSSDGIIQSQITNNSNEIIKRNNSEAAKKAKANAKYSGKK